MSKSVFLDLRRPNADEDYKKWIISRYAEALSFPEYWQPNWDSFDEILFEKLEDKTLKLNVRHIDWTATDYELLAPYRDIIYEAMADNENFVLRDLKSKHC